MSKHTPTPWEIVWERDTDHNPPKRAESVGPVEADHNHWSGWTVCDEADAEFIVRACNSHDDLLAVLERVAELIDCREHAFGRPEIEEASYLKSLHDSLPQAHAAIDKAKAEECNDGCGRECMEEEDEICS